MRTPKWLSFACLSAPLFIIANFGAQSVSAAEAEKGRYYTEHGIDCVIFGSHGLPPAAWLCQHRNLAKRTTLKEPAGKFLTRDEARRIAVTFGQTDSRENRAT